MNAIEKSSRVEKIKLVVNTQRISTYKNLQMLYSPFSIHFCFPPGTVKPCFVSERVTRADSRTVCFSFSNKIWIFRATIVIHVFYMLSQKSGQQSTLFESLSIHFCIHYLCVVKDSKQLLVFQFSTTPRNSM